MTDMGLNRRAFLGTAAAGMAVAGCAGTRMPTGGGQAAPVPVNALVRNRADAQIFRHTDGWYYLTGSVPEYDRLVLRRSRTIAGLSDAEERVLWRHEASGPLSGFIWAPELHLIDGKWVMYFAAGPSGGGEDVFRIRTFAVGCDGADPMTGAWRVLGQFKLPWDSFNLDSTVFTHRGVRYFCWAQREEGIETNSNLYLAPLATALTLGAKPVRLTVPTLDWEIRGFKVAEAAAVLHRNGRLFLTYSASATDDRYCLGMLTASEDADLMNPKSWSKSPEPVFVSSDVTKVYGPGHNSFTVDEQGRDVLVYHGRDYQPITGDPLFDPNRHTRVQRIYYRADGTPDFGIPVGNGAVPDRYSPAGRPNAFLRHRDGRVIVGEGGIPDSQFRALPGLSGEDSISLEPIDAPGRFVVAGRDGTLMVTPQDRSADFNARASFTRQAAGPDHVVLASVGTPGSRIVHAGGEVRVATGSGAAATFRVS